MRVPLIAVFVLTLGSAAVAYGQARPGPVRSDTTVRARGTAVVSGTVIDLGTGDGLPGAVVWAVQLNRAVTTDAAGRFRISGVPSGALTVKASFTGYQTTKQTVVVRSGQTVTLELNLSPGDEGTEVFGIGGLQVTAQSDRLLKDDLSTTTTLDAAEVEHLQATTLGDALDYVAGVDRSGGDALDGPQTVSIRGAVQRRSGDQTSATDRTNIFGTQVLVDGVVRSNNANLAASPGSLGATGGATPTAGTDLRSIPADQIEKIEVISGVPSVEYGDLTGGLVRVETKSGPQPLRGKAKVNPQLYEGSVTGGWRLGRRLDVDGSLVVALAERDLRRTDDGARRFNASVRVTQRLRTAADSSALGTLTLKHNLTSHRLAEGLGVEAPTGRFSRDDSYALNYSLTTDWLRGHTLVNNVAFFNWTHNDRVAQDQLPTDNGVFSAYLTPGTRLVNRVQRSTFRRETLGDQLAFGTRLNTRRTARAFGLLHELLLGLNYAGESNAGPGDRVVGAVTSSEIPRSYSEIPTLHTAALFGEDEVRFRLGIPVRWRVGLRFESYNPFRSSYLGSALQPRTVVSLEPARSTRLRVGYGRTSKVPSLRDAFPQPEFLQIQEEIALPNGVIRRDSILTTYVNRYDKQLGLRGFVQDEIEVGLSQELRKLGALSLAGYVRDRRRDLGSETDQYLLPVRRFTAPVVDPATGLVTSTADSTVGSRLFTRGRPVNAGGQRTWGVEWSLQSRTVPGLGLRLGVSGDYRRSQPRLIPAGFSQKLGVTVPVAAAGSIEAVDNPQGDGRIETFYEADTRIQSEALSFVYRADLVLEPLKAWLTLNVRHIPFVRDIHTGSRRIEAALGYRTETDRYVRLTDTERAAAVAARQSGQLGGIAVFAREIDPALANPRQPAYYRFDGKLSKAVWAGAEVSLYVDNVLNDRATYFTDRGIAVFRNSALFYGIEFSSRF